MLNNYVVFILIFIAKWRLGAINMCVHRPSSSPPKAEVPKVWSLIFL